MMHFLRRALCVAMVLIVLMGTMPSILMPVVQAAISDPGIGVSPGARLSVSDFSPNKTPNNPLQEKTEIYFSGYWTIYVNGSEAGKDAVVKDLVKTGSGKGNADQYNFIPTSRLSEWVQAFDGDPSFVNQYVDNFTLDIRSSERIYIRYLTELCGARIGRVRHIGDGSTGEVHVSPTRRPTAEIGVTPSIRENEPVNIMLSGSTFAQLTDSEVQRVLRSGSSGLIYTLNIDGKPVISSEKVSRNSFSESVPQTFTAGNHTLTLFVKDIVGRFTRKDVSINVQKASIPPALPGGNIPPVALFSMPFQTETNTKVDVTDSSYDVDGHIVKWEWSVEPSTGVTKNLGNTGGTLKFAKEGSYTVKLVVTDNKGATGTYKQVIAVGEDVPPPVPEPPLPKNYPPHARFTLPPKTGQGTTVEVENRSYDSDGMITDVDWQVSPTNGVTEDLGFDGGTITFMETGTFTVRLKVWDDEGDSDSKTKSIEVTNEPPECDIIAPKEVVQGNDVQIGAWAYDPEGELGPITWTITPADGLIGTIEGKSSTVYFDKPGQYKLSLRVEDRWGLFDTDDKMITVLPAIPLSYFSMAGTQKVNRKVTLDATLSQSPSRYPLIWEDTEWLITPPQEVTTEEIKVVSSPDLSKRELLFKKAGEYIVKLRVKNTAGHFSDWYEQTLTIHPDQPPVADFFVQAETIRDPADGNRASIQLFDASYSPDGDTISERVWRYKYDSNNDGSFDDETWQLLDSGNNTNPIFKPTQVGRYSFDLWLREDFGEETIPEFLIPQDYRTADTATKPDNDKICEVGNLQPSVDFGIRIKPKVDLAVTGVLANSSLANTFPGAGNVFATALAGRGIDSKRTITTFGPTTTQQLTQRGEIYFYANRRPFDPFDPANFTAINYDYDSGIGDYGTILRYSSELGGNNFTSLSITVRDLQDVSESNYSPKGTPYVAISTDGSRWQNISMSYTGSYSDWSYLNGSGYYGRAFRFRSSPITTDVRYIRVRDCNNNTYDQRIVNVDATAYGYSEYTIYPTLDNSKLLGTIQWRDDASRYVLLVTDRGNSLTDIPGIINQYAKKGTKIIFVGTSSTRTVGRQLATGTQGAFFEFNGSTIPWQQIEEYLANELLQQQDLTQTVLVGQEVEYETYYNDPETDPELQQRWQYTHNPNYYDNSNGYASFHQNYIADPIKQFDKVGEYSAIFQARDNPKNDVRFDNYRLWSYMPLNSLSIYVHRRPVALFSVEAKPSGGYYTATVTDQSYDLDHTARADKGIAERVWQWKDVTATTWQAGPLPTTLTANREYLVSFTVRDIDGAWSWPHVQTISTKGGNHPPVAQFVVIPPTQYQGLPIEIIDQSYDPDGDPIAQWQWRVKKPDGTWVNHGATIPTNITSLGVGTYVIELTVRDNPRTGLPLWSEPYTQTVTVLELPPQNKPVARFTISPSPVIADETYIINDTSYDPDGDPIVSREWKVKKPNGTWVTISDWKSTFEEMGLDDDGTYTIQLRVLDDPTKRHPALTPMWSDPYTITVQVEGRLKVIGDSDKDTYAAGQALLLDAETEGKAFKVEAQCWWNHNEYTSTNTTTLVPDRTLSDPPQKEMTWHSRRTKAEGRDIIVIIPIKTADGTYPVKFTAYKRKADGSAKTVEDTIHVKVKGTIYDYSHSEIIGK